MKAFFILLWVAAFPLLLNGQTEETPQQSLSLGFTFGPSGITTFEGSPPFQIQTPLYFGPTYFNGNLGINPYYNFGTNGVGVFLMYAFTPDFGSYLVLEQSLDDPVGVYGLGLTTPLFENYVQGFVELGTSYGPGADLYFVMGMYITFGKELKSW